MSTSSTTDQQPPTGLLHVGRLGRPHGVRGEMYVDIFNSHAKRVAIGSKLWVAGKWYEISKSKAQAERWLMTFKDLDDRNIAERLTNSDVYGYPIDDPSVVWVHEMVGSTVVDTQGNDYGVCVAVIDNPAHPIMELESGALVPTPFIVSNVDGCITIDPPAGLFDLGFDSGEES